MKKRHFTLLEVLIALLLITAALPLLLSPFIYATVDQMETVKKMTQEKLAFSELTNTLARLQMGAIPISHLESNQEYPFNEGSYRFKKLKSGDNLELWQIIFTFKEGNPFAFNFIVKRHATTEET